MSKVIFAIIGITLLALTMMTGAQNFLSSLNSTTTEFVDQRTRDENTIRTSISPVSSIVLPGRQIVEFTLSNDGETKLADFALWDITVQYYDYLNNYQVYWLDYVTGTPGDNQWTVEGIYLDAEAETSELLETGVLNPGEEIVIQVKLSPKVHISAYNLAIISTPNGVKAWNYFQFQALFPHNNPTPPVGDTEDQANLSLSYTAPTATTLYNYDTNNDNDPGRWIQQSWCYVWETDMDEYQNWRIQFSDPVIDTLEFETLEAFTSDIIRVSGDIYAIAYRRDSDEDGFLKTVEISSAGAITDTVVDTLEFDDSAGWEPSIIHVSGDIYAIAYRGPSDTGFLKTVEISSAGEITNTVVDTLGFEYNEAFKPDIIHVSGDIYAIAYRRDSDDDGFLKTVEISPAGEITDPVVDTLEFETDEAFELDIIHVSGDIYAIAYRRGSDDDGFIKTVEISTAGEITDTVIDTLEFETNEAFELDIIHVSGDIYAIAYRRGSDDDGFLKTVEISSAGEITDTVVDTLEFHPGNCYEPAIIHVSGDIYAIAFEDYYYDGLLKTVEISSAGAIADTVIDTLEFDTSNGEGPDIIHVGGDVYAVAYQGPSDDGFLKTIEILSDGTFGTDIEINGDVNFIFWSGMEDFTQSERGAVVVYLRDYDGADYTTIATTSLDLEDWQDGSATWVENTITFSDVTYTISAGHYLELKVMVHYNSDDDIWFAYDTTDYASYLKLP
ncbi:hypothetical protein ACFLUZ_01285 [Chloroflexota bacterium]